MVCIATPNMQSSLCLRSFCSSSIISPCFSIKLQMYCSLDSTLATLARALCSLTSGIHQHNGTLVNSSLLSLRMIQLLCSCASPASYRYSSTPIFYYLGLYYTQETSNSAATTFKNKLVNLTNRGISSSYTAKESIKRRSSALISLSLR